MLPELSSFSHLGLTAKLATDLVEFLMYVKDTVDKTIVSAVAGSVGGQGQDAAAALLNI